MLRISTTRALAAARRNARAGEWSDAARHYADFLDRRPQDARTWVQYGHVLKEAGEWQRAADAYARSLELAPDIAETWWHLGQLRRRLGDRDAAIACCRRVLAIDAGFPNAIDELAALTPAAGNPDWFERRHAAGTSGVYALADFDRYRQQIVIGPPPRVRASPATLTVLVDARVAIAADVRATLSSLLDQTHGEWQAIVFASTAIRDHSVASLALLDARVTFVDREARFPDAATAPCSILLAAGTVLDRQALAWFAFARARTGCVAAYSDHDRCIDHWRSGRRYEAPVFQPLYDPDWFACGAVAPAAILVDRSRVAIPTWPATRADLLAAAAPVGGVAHLPMLLASIKQMARTAADAPPEPASDPIEPPLPDAAHPAPASAAARTERIQVILQTRDEPAMLRIAVESLRDRATWPALLDITIVDNRSGLPATQSLLAGWAKRDIAQNLRLDTPFNWSHANNVAAAHGTAPLLLFLNNDTEMLTAGWDEAVRDALARPEIGALGALLLYPDRTIQHAGMIMGMGTGGPIHEGVGHAEDAPGPADRWQRPHAAAAVTGAFLAMRRDVFDDVGGFDAAGLAIAFNDVDLCLRVRATGRHILYAPQIRAIHHESKTRGLNVTQARVAWDLEEVQVLHRRWGAALFEDPGYNPHWTTIGEPFLGYRFPAAREILRHLDRSVDGWRVTAEAEEPAWW